MKILIFVIGMMVGGAVAVTFMALLQAGHDGYSRSGNDEKKECANHVPSE